jgi:hypothetical protein
LLTALAIWLAIPAGASAENGSGWSLPNLNPFAKKGAPPTSARVSDEGGWRLPGLMPRTSKASAAKAKAPSTWQRMTTGTKTFFAKTADAINPFDDESDNQPVHVTGSRNKFRQAAAKKNEKTGSFFPSLWGEPEPEAPKSVTEFLNAPRPGFSD